MPRIHPGKILLLVVLVLPLFVYRGATRGYFEDDDLDNLIWARRATIPGFLTEIVRVEYPFQPSRPVGNLFYGLMQRAADLNYLPWPVVLQCMGVINVLLLWLLLRTLQFDHLTTAAGCVFWICSHSLFDAWWKPMFVFDVLCGTFTLAAMLAYVKRWWLVSFAAFWLALRSKEIAVVFPFVLLVYELTAGDRKWKRTLPFFIPAILFGAGGWWYNRTQAAGAYHMQFSINALWTSLKFYLTAIFGIWYGVFLLAIPLWRARDRRVLFGLGFAALQIALYLLLPGRLLQVYLYVCAIGLAIIVASFFQRWPRIATAALVLWLIPQYILARRAVRENVRSGSDRRAFVAALQHLPPAPEYYYVNGPSSMQYWGIAAAIHLFQPEKPVTQIEAVVSPRDPVVPILTWDPQSRRLAAPQFSRFTCCSHTRPAPLEPWQGVDPWSPDAAGYQPIGNKTSIRLFHFKTANEYGWELCGTPGASVRIFVDGEEFPEVRFQGHECVTQKGKLQADHGERFLIVDFLKSSQGGEPRLGTFGFLP